MYYFYIWIKIIVNMLILLSISGIIYSDLSKKVKSKPIHLTNYKNRISKMSTRHEMTNGNEYFNHLRNYKLNKSKLEINSNKRIKSLEESNEETENDENLNLEWFKLLLNSSLVNSKDTVIPKQELFLEATRMIENYKENELSGLPKSRNNRNRLTHHNDFIEKFLNLNRLNKQSSHSKRGEGPQLSVLSPLDVLRERFMLEMARRRIKENKEQIQANAEILKNLGKRSVQAQEEDVYYFKTKSGKNKIESNQPKNNLLTKSLR